MTNEVKINAGDFSMVYTPYGFAELYRSRMDIKDEIAEAAIKRRKNGYCEVLLKFKREAHSLSLSDVAEFLDCHYVFSGTLTDGTNVICAVD